MTVTVTGTITTIGVSPVNTAIIWAGTDDGNIWVTENSGQAWTQVDPPGFSQWVTAVEADPFDARTAYVTFFGSLEGSSAPHVLRTSTLGASWTEISGDLLQEPLHCVAADPDHRGRLFAGTEAGVYMTEDGGASWSGMSGGMPPVVVLDLDLIQTTRTLFAGTHGRSLYSFDLSQLPPPDRDGDGVVNSQDCAPDDAGAFAVPSEVTNLAIALDGQSLSWHSAAPGAGSGTLHDLLRGNLRQLPVGSGVAEGCLARGVLGTTSSDASVPAPGSGFWYLVRGRNVCGPGTYGTRSDGTPRVSAACD